jgi:hypothetical protein
MDSVTANPLKMDYLSPPTPHILRQKDGAGVCQDNLAAGALDRMGQQVNVRVLVPVSEAGDEDLEPLGGWTNHF